MNLHYSTFFLLLIVLLLAINRINMALDELDIGRFYLWTSIAIVIFNLPLILR